MVAGGSLGTIIVVFMPRFFRCSPAALWLPIASPSGLKCTTKTQFLEPLRCRAAWLKRFFLSLMYGFFTNLLLYFEKVDLSAVVF